jgi:predicted RNA-binding Zn-ribbon protein involved in translation (DUF1610 family)
LANYANNQIVGITANEIMRFPTVEAEPVKHARWEQCCNLMGEYFKCSECGYKAEVPTCMGEPIYIFCPNCGAKMDEKHEGKSADACFIDEPGNPHYETILTSDGSAADD